jgi:hypothetical protein
MYIKDEDRSKEFGESISNPAYGYDDIFYMLENAKQNVMNNIKDLYKNEYSKVKSICRKEVLDIYNRVVIDDDYVTKYKLSGCGLDSCYNILIDCILHINGFSEKCMTLKNLTYCYFFILLFVDKNDPDDIKVLNAEREFFEKFGLSIGRD